MGAPEGCKFSGGVAKGNLLLSTGILQLSWSCLSGQQSPGRFSVHEFPKFKIIAFRENQSQPGQPTLERLHKSDSTFGFLITKKNTTVSLHASAFSVFVNLLQTTDLKEKLNALTAKGQPRLILVGESLGGSVAALCTLWLLKNGPLLPPICITFGSPLLGDEGLQKAVSNIEPWTTHFWHVVDRGDPTPRLFLPHSFRPFGTYFVAAGSTCACFDDPDSTVQLLQAGCPDDPANTHFRGYGAVLQQLVEKKYRSKNILSSAHGFDDSLKACLRLQLAAAGIGTEHPQQVELLLEKMKERAMFLVGVRNRGPTPSKKLNEVKQGMAKLEWYMKFCNKNYESVYYDGYKKRREQRDIDMKTQVKLLNSYWKNKVLEAECKPQEADARMRTRWLFSGITYMRMVEPLNIADHYRYPPPQGYLTVRDEHYKLLDEWNDEEARRVPRNRKRKAPGLTEDSCFWARVEDAILKLGELEEGTGTDRELQLKKELVEFEAYVMKSVNNYELSPDVFKPKTSFLDWWKKYHGVTTPGYYSPVVPLELPQGFQEHGQAIRWWTDCNQEAGAVAGHRSTDIHVRFWNGLGLSSDGFLNEENEFMLSWRDNENRTLNPADISPFSYFMKGGFYRNYN